jgi:hypothetical protein
MQSCVPTLSNCLIPDGFELYPFGKQEKAVVNEWFAGEGLTSMYCPAFPIADSAIVLLIGCEMHKIVYSSISCFSKPCLTYLYLALQINLSKCGDLAWDHY